MSLTGSTRKLFSVGEALDQLGADHRQTTPVYRQGTVDGGGVLQGNLILVAGGDLEFGGRRIDANTVQYTNFDHNDANGLGSAILTPQDPLYALNDLARQVKASGVASVSGDVVIDDRLFEPYRVPNGNLLITPMMLNENMVDVTVTPTAAGQPATLAYRPETAALTVDSTAKTVAAGTADTKVTLSDDTRPACIGTPGCTATVSGDIPVGYKGPLTGSDSFVGTFRIDDPDAMARTAFIEALVRNGVAVTAPPVAANDASKLSPTVLPGGYPADTQVATYQSAPFAQTAQLVLKVSLNLGANLSLSLFGLTQGERTVQGALTAERKTLIDKYGVDGSQFTFPTNGSGTPDSEAAPRALVQMLIAMSKTHVAAEYLAALPAMGENGSLATSGTTLSGKGHVFAKPGTTVSADDNGDLELKAQNLAGYVKTKNGHTIAYALMVNDAGPIKDFGADIGGVFEDEASISNVIYENL
jgi:PBP4 family serine-type D-alanyl-D-alanine carboxypeptidase